MAASYRPSDALDDPEQLVDGLVSSANTSCPPPIGSVHLIPAVQHQQHHLHQPRLLPPTAYCIPDGHDCTAPMSFHPSKRLRSGFNLSEPHASKRMRVDAQYSLRYRSDDGSGQAQQVQVLRPELSLNASQPVVYAPVTTNSKVYHVNDITLETGQGSSNPAYKASDALDAGYSIDHAPRAPEQLSYGPPFGDHAYRQYDPRSSTSASMPVTDDWLVAQTPELHQPHHAYVPTSNEEHYAPWSQLNHRQHYPYIGTGNSMPIVQGDGFVPVGSLLAPSNEMVEVNQMSDERQPAPLTERSWVQNFTGNQPPIPIPPNSRTLVPVQYPSAYISGGGPVSTNASIPTPIAQVPEADTGRLEAYQNQRRVKRRSAFQPEQRDETRKTRRLRACIRCHMQKIRCGRDPQDENGPCLTCQGVTGPTLSGQPCFRMKISDVTIYNYTPHPPFKWSRRWESMKMDEVKHWSSPEIKTIKVTQDIGGTAYNLRVRQFINQDGDAILRTWRTNGKKKCYTCTKWAIENMKRTGEELVEFVDKNMAASIEHFVDEADTLLHSTYAMAYRYSQVAENEEERTLLKHVLRLWVACRLNSASERICGDETLGMQPQDFDPLAKNFGMVLTPPIIAAQLTLIITVSLLLPMKHAVLQGLQKLLEANKAKYWFTIYLTMFILLHSCAMFTAFEQKQSLKHGLTARYENPSQIEELHNSAKIMLAYFHYCSKGDSAFHSDWRSSKTALLADLNPEQVEFLQGATEQVEKRRTKFDDIKQSGHFENDYFFLSQLYDKDWRPVPTI